MSQEDISIGIEATGADTTADSINKVTQAVKGLNDVSTSNLSAFATSLDNIKTSATGVNAPLTTAETGVKSLGGAYDETVTKSKDLENSFSDLGGKTQSASQNFQSFAQSMVGLVGSIATISSGIIGIAQGYTEMERAQTLVQRSSDRYQQALLNENNLRDKLNRLIAEGKGGTADAAKLEDQIALAHNKTATALETLNNNQSRANEVTATFYSQIVPQAVGIIGGLATAITTIPTAWDKIKTALQGTNIFGGLKADATDIEAAQKGLASSSNDVNTALNAEGAAANTASVGTRSLKTEALALAAPFIASAAAVVGFSLGMQQIGEHAEEVHNFFDKLDTQITASVPQMQGWASSFGDALATTGAFFNDNVKQIESWGGLSKSVMSASADDVQKLADEFARSGQSESLYWDNRFKQWKQAADSSHQTFAAIAKDNIDQMREDQNRGTSAQQAADTIAAAKKKEEDAAKHYAEIVKDTSKVLQDDLTKSLDVLQQESTGVIKNWEQFGTSGTTVRTAFVELNTEVQNTTKGLESHNKFADDTIKILTPLQGIAKQVGGTFQTEYNAALLAAIKVHNGVTDSIQPIITHLKAMDDATHTVNAGINAQKAAFDAAASSMVDTTGKLQQLEKTIQDGTQINQSFNQGQQDQENAMRTNEEAIAKQAGSLKKYYDQIATGRPLNDAFIKGFEDQAKIFADQAVAIADTQGGLTAYFLAIQTGVPQLEAFDKGQQDQYAAFIQNGLAIDTTLGKQKEYFREIQDGSGVIQIQNKALVDLTDAYNKSGEKLIALNTGLADSKALWTRYETDVNNGKSAVGEFETKLQDTKATQDTELQGLEAIASNIQGWPTWMRPTIETVGEFITANYNGAQAIIDFNQKATSAWQSLTSAGSTFFSALIKSFGETGKTSSDDFIKAFTDLPPEIQRMLTPSDKASLAAQAAFAHAGDVAGQAFAIETQSALGKGFTPQQSLQIGATAAASIIQGFVQQHPQFAAQAQQFFSVLSSGSADQIKKALDQMAQMPGPLGEVARNAQTALKPMFSELGTDASTSVKTSTDALEKLGLKVNTVSGQVTTASGQIVGSINTATGAFQALQTPVSLSADALRQLGLNFNTTSGQVTTASGQIVGSINTTTGAFQAIPGAIDPATKSVQAFSDTWASLVQQSNAVTAGTTLTSRFANTKINTANVGGLTLPTPDTTAFTAAMDAATAKVKGFATTLNTEFQKGAQDAAGSLNGLKTQADTDFKAIATSINAIPTAMNTAFQKGAQDAAGSLNNLKTQSDTDFKAITTSINAISGSMNTAFKTGAQDAAGSLNNLKTQSDTDFGAITASINAIPVAMNTAFQRGAQDAAGSLNNLKTQAQTDFSAMVTSAQTAANAIAAAFRAAIAVQQQAQAQSFTPNQGVFQPQTGQAAQFTPFQGVFAQHGFVGIVDKPTQFVVGEAGPEYVSVIPGGGAGTIGNTMTVGLSNMVLNISRTNDAMTFYLVASNRNTNALTNSSTAADKSTKSLNDVTTSANNNLIATNTNTLATSNSTTALNTNTVATAAGTKQILQIPQAANNTTTGLNGTTNAANGATGALGNMANAMNQVPAQFADLMARMQAGVQASAFAGLAQYGNFTGQSPAAAPGAAYYGGPPTGGGNLGPGAPLGVGPFGGLAQYGNFSGQSPAAAPGTAYYGGPPTGGSGIQGAPAGVGPFGGLAQYGQFGGAQPAAAPGTAYYGGPPTGQQPSTGQPQQQSGQQSGAGVQGPQGGASSPSTQQPQAVQGGYGFQAPGYQRTLPAKEPLPGQTAASGFDGIVSRATAFIAGEAGPEHVRVTPLKDIGSSSNDVNSILAMIAELVRQITNQSLNINLASYLDGYQVYKNQQKYTQGRTGNYLG